MPTTAQFIRALNAMPDPSLRMQDLLRAHATAPKYISTARKLADAAHYESWRGMNLQYGLLGRRIARQLGSSSANLSLLAEFIERETVSNKEWLVIMKPAFARAVRKTHWF